MRLNNGKNNPGIDSRIMIDPRMNIALCYHYLGKFNAVKPMLNRILSSINT